MYEKVQCSQPWAFLRRERERERLSNKEKGALSLSLAHKKFLPPPFILQISDESAKMKAVQIFSGLKFSIRRISNSADHEVYGETDTFLSEGCRFIVQKKRTPRSKHYSEPCKVIFFSV